MKPKGLPEFPGKITGITPETPQNVPCTPRDPQRTPEAPTNRVNHVILAFMINEIIIIVLITTNVKLRYSRNATISSYWIKQ